jgi:hypothetical protein
MFKYDPFFTTYERNNRVDFPSAGLFSVDSSSTAGLTISLDLG